MANTLREELYKTLEYRSKIQGERKKELDDFAKFLRQYFGERYFYEQQDGSFGIRRNHVLDVFIECDCRRIQCSIVAKNKHGERIFDFVDVYAENVRLLHVKDKIVEMSVEALRKMDSDLIQHYIYNYSNESNKI